MKSIFLSLVLFLGFLTVPINADAGRMKMQEEPKGCRELCFAILPEFKESSRSRSMVKCILKCSKAFKGKREGAPSKKCHKLQRAVDAICKK